MEKIYKFIIPVDPKAKKRPKVYRWSTVNPSQNDEEVIASLFNQLEGQPDKPLNGQIRVQAKFFKNPPKNTPKWQLPLMEQGVFRPAKSPDLDNYVKLILDALNGLLWEDDRYIVEMHSGKFYTTNQPRIELVVNQLPTPTRKNKDIISTNSNLYDAIDTFFSIDNSDIG
ncbi:MAG: RusA family crossover junction endodeoxyribonuclease [Candidatus Kariarchaeaceae archaeon]